MIILISLCLRFAAADVSPIRVMLDPGHGGRDHGAVAGVGEEARVTYDVATRLAALLRADRKFKVDLTRADDQTVSLSERTRRAHAWRADLFLSIHVNSSPDPRAHGAEFYFQNQRAADEESAFLAFRENELDKDEPKPGAAPRPAAMANLDGESAAIVGDLLDSNRVLSSSRLSKALKVNWGGPRKGALDSVRQAPFFVLSRINMPSALVELGFLTHADDNRRLLSSGGRQAMARDLYRGLQRYVESFTTGNATRQP